MIVSGNGASSRFGIILPIKRQAWSYLQKDTYVGIWRIKSKLPNSIFDVIYSHISASRMREFVELPIKVICLIVYSGDVRTITNMASVSKFLHSICRNQILWKGITGRDYKKFTLPTLHRPYLWNDYYRDLYHDNIIKVEVIAVGGCRDVVYIRGGETMNSVKNKLFNIIKGYILPTTLRWDIYFAGWSPSFTSPHVYTCDVRTNLLLTSGRSEMKGGVLWETRSICIDMVTREDQHPTKYNCIIVNRQHYIWYNNQERDTRAILKAIKMLVRLGMKAWIRIGLCRMKLSLKENTEERDIANIDFFLVSRYPDRGSFVYVEY